MFRSAHIYRQIALSLVLNWIVGPFVRRVAVLLEGAHPCPFARR